MRIPLRLLFAVVVAPLGACPSNDGAVECKVDEDCNLGSMGSCDVYAPTGNEWCSYADSTCPSGRRWSDYRTGDGLSGECQDPAQIVDAGIDAPPPDADNFDAFYLDGGGDITPIIGRVAAGYAHTCALVGTNVRCWGEGDLGRLGYGDTVDVGDNETPLSKGNVGVGAAVAQIAAGQFHTCALLGTGAIRCWGSGATGRLGYGNVNNIGDNEAPSTAGDVSVGGTVLQVAPGDNFTCALLDGGTVRCWGWGNAGRLGYGNTTDIGDNELPSSVGTVDVGGTVTQITAGGSHACALLSGGTVRCWGFGGNGQLGYGNTNSIGDNEAPAAAGDVSVGGTVVQISARGNHTCALIDDGAVRCWGYGGAGVLGLNGTATIGDNELPSSQPAIDLGGVAVLVAAGVSHNCALLHDGRVRCWGEADYGRLGYGDQLDVGDNEDPYSKGDVNLGGISLGLAPGGEHTCALLDDGNLRCWGQADFGRLGYGDTTDIGDDEVPASKGNVPYM